MKLDQAFLLAALSFAPSAALAFTMGITDGEWSLLSDYCKRAYVSSANGSKSRFRYRYFYEEAQLEAARRSLGPVAGPWHYCGAKIWMIRARALLPGNPGRDFALKQAVSEATFTYPKTADTHWVKEDAGVLLGRAYTMMGEYHVAEIYLAETLALFPASEKVYGAFYLLYRAQGRYDAAIEVLERGNKALQSRSAQIHYWLGLAYAERDDLENAKKHAARAYELKYPLPGLKERIRELEDERAKAQGSPGAAEREEGTSG